MSPVSPLPVHSSALRSATVVLDEPGPAPSFFIDATNKSYKHQYSNIYFMRLRMLRDTVEQKALERWRDMQGSPVLVPRVLEVVKSRLCYIIGTVYMDMPLKPNVMEDIARDHSIPPLPPNNKIYSPRDSVMLEDESGRIRLVGERVKEARLVTGVIIGALGAETPNGDFEVVDICYPGLAPQAGINSEPNRDENSMDTDDQIPAQSHWIAVVSGLNVDSDSSDARIQLLVEYLTGEEGGLFEQDSAAKISRLIIAGNSLAPLTPSIHGELAELEPERKSRQQGEDVATLSPHPVLELSDYLHDIATALPVHIFPGENDPSGTIMPQQPLPRAMFGAVAKLSTFTCETNPAYLRLSSAPQELVDNTKSYPNIERTLLVNSGQPLNDMFKYLPSPPNTRLSILESTLKWRHMAPTAPDTLWCHPYFAQDPFVITETPDLYLVGNQDRFATTLVIDEDEGSGEPRRRCRIVMVPDFARSGVLVLIDLRSLDVRTVIFAIQGTAGAREGASNDHPQQSPSPSLDTSLTSTAPKTSMHSGFL